MGKIIHCIWLGGSKTKLAERCRASWMRFAPEFEIHEWSLTRDGDDWRLMLDGRDSGKISLPKYVLDAFKAKKWAFVSDWLRFVVLEREGGIYFDYDLELVKPLLPALDELGLSDIEWCAMEWLKDGSQGMASGGGIALARHSESARRMLEAYESMGFDATTTVGDMMALKGIRLKGVWPDVFCPFDHHHNSLKTARTVGVHHYALSWISPQRRIARWLNWHGLGSVTEFLLKVKGLVKK